MDKIAYQMEALRRQESDISELMARVSPAFIAKHALLHPLFFAKYVVGFSEVDEKVHSSIEAHLMSGKRYTLFLLPRDTFKTSIITISESVRLICENPNRRILIDSENFTNAANMIGTIKNIIEKNPLILSLYGIEPGKKWNEEEAEVKRSKFVKEPTFTASGIGNEKTSAHYDYIKSDDPVTPRNVNTAEQRKKVREHFRYNLSLLNTEPGSAYHVIGTRYSDLDLYGWIVAELAGEGPDDFAVLLERAVRLVHWDWEELERQVSGDPGILYFPARLNVKRLRDIRHKQGIYIFSCQYQNEPVAQEGQEFEWTQWKIEPEIPEHIRRGTIAVLDPAAEDEKGLEKTDFSALVIMAADEYGEPWILDIELSRGNETVISDMAIAAAKKWKIGKLIIEKNGFQKTYKNIIDFKKRGEDLSFKTVPVLSSAWASKAQKIRSLVPFSETGGIHIYAGILEKSEIWEELKDEASRFPKGRHDDILDAMQMGLSEIEPTVPKKQKPKTFAEMIYEKAHIKPAADKPKRVKRWVKNGRGQ
mgnify:CR=1 FL=1